MCYVKYVTDKPSLRIDNFLKGNPLIVNIMSLAQSFDHCDWDKRKTGWRVINKKRLSEGESNPQTSEQVFKTWGSKCLALIAQMVRAFGMNPKIGASSSPRAETFFVS